MQEVQALCDRVIIINKGKIAADDQLKNLVGQNENVFVITVEFKEPITAGDLSSIDGVEKVQPDGKQFRVHSTKDIRNELIRFATEKNLSLLSLKQEENSIEEIFRSLTSEATA